MCVYTLYLRIDALKILLNMVNLGMNGTLITLVGHIFPHRQLWLWCHVAC